MNIQFETDNIHSRDAQGIILLLTSLFPALSNSNPVSPSVPPVPTTEAQAIGGVPIPIQPTPADAPIPAEALQQTAPTPGPTLVQPEPSTRKRRTKAEIAADEAQTKAQAALVAGIPVAEADTTPERTPTVGDRLMAAEAERAASAHAQVAKPLSADELRSLLNAYITKHSMEAAIAILQSFGCGRVTEALALEPAKLNELAEKLRG